MFETSSIRAHAAVAPQRVGLLTASVAFHSFAVLAVIVASVHAVHFPPNAPNQFELLRLVAPPMMEAPKGNPDADRNQTKQPPAQKPATPAPAQPQLTAPSTTPDTIPTVTPATDTASIGEPGPSTPGTGERWGTPDGNKDAIDIGQPIPPAPVVAAGPLTPGIGDVRSAAVLHRVDPVYPRVAIASRMPGVVKVRCIIDKTGHISNPEVVSSTFAAFEQPTLDALKQWTFSPGTLHGQPVDTWFELTVTFKAQ